MQLIQTGMHMLCCLLHGWKPVTFRDTAPALSPNCGTLILRTTAEQANRCGSDIVMHVQRVTLPTKTRAKQLAALVLVRTSSTENLDWHVLIDELIKQQ